MRRTLIVGFVALLAVGLFAWLRREPIALGYFAAKVPKTTLAEHEALIAPSMQFLPPPGGAPPYPAVIQFHGCGGMRQDFMETWAEAAHESGLMAVIVDSYAPRGIGRDMAVSQVCEGKRLLGQERAGDALAAYEIVRKRSDVDPARIVLAGWSHGAWSVMDLLALGPPGRMPAGLRNDGVAPPELAGVVLFYPYCGYGTWARLGDFRVKAPTLALVGGKDSIVSGPECLTVFERMKRRGLAVDLAVYPEADHAFDDADLPDDWRYLYNADAHADARRRVVSFLSTIAGD